MNEEQPEESPTSGKTYVKILGVWTYVWNTRGVERGYEYRLGVKLDDVSLPRDATLGDVVALVRRNLEVRA